MLPKLIPDRSLDDVTRRFLEALAQSDFRGEIADDYASRLIMATDNSVYQVMPQAVVYPVCLEDLNVVAELGARDEFDGLSFVPRGGGTGTNGQSLNNCVVLDASKHLNKILDFDPEAQTVTVEPGVVLDQLNAFLKDHGFFFPPTVSTSSRATLGGMTGTDASGKGSRIYGKVSDYIEEMDVVLSDGQSWTSKPLSAEDLKQVMAREDVVGAIHKQAFKSINDNRALIEKTFPKMNRGLTGYNLEKTLKKDGTFDLSYLLAGSEGSLCLTRKITFRVLPLPKAKGLVTVRYATFNDALEGVGTLLKADPAAIEVVDDKIMSMAQQDIIWTDVKSMLGPEAGEPDVMGMNFVEFVGDSPEEVAHRIKALEDILASVKGQSGQATGWRSTNDPSQIAALWEMRKKSVGLLGALQGKRRAIPFVEDTAVPPESLAAFIREFRDLLDHHGVEYGMFGHADVGCLHVRPTLDLTDEMDEPILRQISDGVVALTQKYGGLLWGEHGKGFRGEYSPKFFGPELYDELRKIKAAFDPKNKFNPGKIATPYTMADLKLTAIDEAPMRGQYDRTVATDLKSAYPKAMMCNGNGQCFTWDAYDAMCPSYKATRDRVQSPKGRAGVLREWLRLQSVGQTGRTGEDFSHEVYRALKTCLSCKACATQCPVKVDIPEMKSQFLERYHARYPRPWRDRLIARLEPMAPLTRRFSGLTNFMQSLGATRTLIKKVFGLVDLPRVTNVSLKAALRERAAPDFDLRTMTSLRPDEKARSVVLIQDTFTTFYDVDVVLAHYDLLSQLGYSVYLAPWRANGKPLHVKGFLKDFDALAKSNDDFYAKIAQTGLAMVGIESAVTLMYRQEYAQRLSTRADYTIHAFHEWFHGQLDQVKTVLPGTCEPGTFKLFAHCTEKTSLPETPHHWGEIFQVFNQSLKIEKTGCCGMAGLFGHEAEHQDLSRKLFDMSWKEKAEKAGQDRMLATGFSCRCQTKRYLDFKPKHPVEALLHVLQKEFY